MTGKRKGPNAYRIEGDIAYLELTQGKVALVDVAELPRVLKHRWVAVNTDKRALGGRLYARATDCPLYMHRLIVNAGPHEQVDHINGNPMDNLRANLRSASNQQNAQNRSRPDPRSKTGVRGVCIHKAPNGNLYWIAKVSVTRYFSFTDEGYENAVAESKRLRNLLIKQGLG